MNTLEPRGLEPNQVLVHMDTVELGPYRLEWFNSLVDADLTNSWVRTRLLTCELEGYLNQYFPDWKLLRRVTTVRHHPGGTPAKHLQYVIQVDTDADAETLRSHLVRTDYQAPL